jgi:hypothetical protein
MKLDVHIPNSTTLIYSYVGWIKDNRNNWRSMLNSSIRKIMILMSWHDFMLLTESMNSHMSHTQAVSSRIDQIIEIVLFDNDRLFYHDLIINRINHFIRDHGINHCSCILITWWKKQNIILVLIWKRHTNILIIIIDCVNMSLGDGWLIFSFEISFHCRMSFKTA